MDKILAIKILIIATPMMLWGQAIMLYTQHQSDVGIAFQAAGASSLSACVYIAKWMRRAE